MNITPALFHKLNGTFIRPHLQNSFQAWLPWLKKDIKLPEDVQRRLKDTVYEERANLLNLESLFCRLGKRGMILVYKILHGFLEIVQWRDFFQMAAATVTATERTVLAH